MRLLALGPSHIIAMQRPFRWTVEQDFDVWLMAPRRIPVPEHQTYRFILCLGSWVFLGLRPLLGVTMATLGYLFFSTIQVRIVCWVLRPDLVHAYHLKLEAAACALARVKPLVVSLWGGLPNQLPPKTKLKLRKRIARYTLDQSDLCIAVSELQAARVREFAGESIRTKVIPLGADTELFNGSYHAEANQLRNQLNIPKETTVLFSPRGLSELYGHHHILEAFHRARETVQKDSYLFFGQLQRQFPRDTRKYIEQLKTRAETLGLTPYIRWLPALPHEKMPVAYSMADIVINYPREEAWPSTLCEAAASKRPILSSNLESYEGSFVTSCCTCVPAEDPNALAQALADMLNREPQSLDAPIARARTIIEETFDEKTFAQELMQFYASYGNTPVEKNV